MGGLISFDMQELKEDLKKKGYKLTPQRRAIVDTIIRNEGNHLTAEEIYDEVKKDCPEIGLATVYRTVALLEEVNLLSRLELSDGCSRYEIIHQDEEHRHHHLSCTKCNKVLEVEEDLSDELEQRVESKYKFKIQDHSVKFFGICENCMEKEKNKEN